MIKNIILYIALATFISFPAYANTNSNELLAKLFYGHWGGEGCTVGTALAAYEIDAKGALYRQEKAPTDQSKPHIKWLYHDAQLISENRYKITSSAVDIKTGKTLANVNGIVIVEENRQRLIEQKIDNQLVISNGVRLTGNQKPIDWTFRCKSDLDKNILTSAESRNFYFVPMQSGEQKDQTCAQNNLLNNSQKTTTQERVITEGEVIFVNPNPSKTFTSIKSIEIRNGMLLTIFEVKSLHEELKGKLIKIVEKTSYEANPGVAVIANTLTLGLGVLLSPQKTLQHAFGCTDEWIQKKEVDITASVPTGKYEFRNLITHTHEIQISGLGAPKTIKIKSSIKDEVHSAAINLIPWMMKEDLNEVSSVNVACLSCSKETEDKRFVELNPKSEISVSHDFRQFKNATVEAIRAQQEQFAKAEKERLNREKTEQERLENIRRAEIAEQKRQEMQRQAEVKQRDEEKRAEEKRILASKEKCLSNGSIGLCSVITIQEGGSVTVVYEGRNNLPQSLNTVRFVCTQFGRDGFPIRSHTLPIAGSFNSKEIKEFKLSAVKDLQFHSIECKLKDWQ